MIITKKNNNNNNNNNKNNLPTATTPTPWFSSRSLRGEISKLLKVQSVEEVVSLGYCCCNNNEISKL